MNVWRLPRVFAFSAASFILSSHAFAGLISVDLGVAGRPLPFSGVEPQAAAIDGVFAEAALWNELGLASDWKEPPTTDPSFENLLDNTGNPTRISLSLRGNLNSFNYNINYSEPGTGPLFGDYWFFNSRYASDEIEWILSGLMPNTTYRMVFYGPSNDQNRVFDMFVDTDGDGDLTDEQAVSVHSMAGAFPAPTYVDTIISSDSGKILGRGVGKERTTPDLQYEANWAGFQLVAVPRTPTVPEPATLALLGLGLAGLGWSRRQHAF